MDTRVKRWWATALVALAIGLGSVSAGLGSPPAGKDETADVIAARTLIESAQDARARRKTAPVFMVDGSTVEPRETDGLAVSCPRSAPQAIAGLFLVISEEVGSGGEVQLGDFFPSVNVKGTRADGWVVGVQNLTDQPQEWIGGAVCSRTAARYLFFDAEAPPFGVDGRVISCPRALPNAVSGLFLAASETTGQVQLGDFFPQPARGGPPYRGRGWVVAVKNLTGGDQKWVGGVVCTKQRTVISFGSAGPVPPLEIGAALPGCPRGLPHAVSGFFLVVTEETEELTGQLRVGDFFPSPGRRGTIGREWVISVRNLTAEPQDWISGAICMGRGSGIRASGGPPALVAQVDPKYPTARPSSRQLRKLCKKPYYREQSRKHRRWCRPYR